MSSQLEPAISSRILVSGYLVLMSADQYHVTISWAQVEAHRGLLFIFKVDRWPSTGFQLDGRLKPVQIRALSRKLDALPFLYSQRLSCLGGKEFGKKIPSFFGGFNIVGRNSYLRKKAHQVHVHVSKYDRKLSQSCQGNVTPHWIGLRTVNNIHRRLSLKQGTENWETENGERGISTCFTLLTPPDITPMIFFPIDKTIVEFQIQLAQ